MFIVYLSYIYSMLKVGRGCFLSAGDPSVSSGITPRLLLCVTSLRSGERDVKKCVLRVVYYEYFFVSLQDI
jgi:hypothetical protein